MEVDGVMACVLLCHNFLHLLQLKYFEYVSAPKIKFYKYRRYKQWLKRHMR